MIARLLAWLGLDRWNEGYERGYQDGWADCSTIVKEDGPSQ